MKKLLILIVLIIVVVIAVMYFGAPKAEAPSDSAAIDLSTDTTESIIADLETVVDGNLEGDFNSLDADINAL